MLNSYSYSNYYGCYCWYCLACHIFGVWQNSGLCRAHLQAIFFRFHYCLLPEIQLEHHEDRWSEWKRERKRERAGMSFKCTTWNCKILNHNFIFLLHFKFIERQTQPKFYGFNWNQFIWEHYTTISRPLPPARLCFTRSEKFKMIKKFLRFLKWQLYYCPSFARLPLPKWFCYFFSQIVEDWKFVSMVLDRFFLWLFTLSCVFGTCAIICQSPSLYDTRSPVDRLYSEIPLRKSNFMLPPDIVRQVVN